MEISSFTHSPFLFEGSFASFNTSVRDVMPPTFQNWFQRAKLNPKVLFDTISDNVTPAIPTLPIKKKLRL